MIPFSTCSPLASCHFFFQSTDVKQRTVASVWVLNLAMSDFLATLTLPVFTFYLHSSHSWELGNSLCKIQSSIFFLNMFVSAFLLAAISMDRCLLVTKPVWSQNHRSVEGAWKLCGLGWLWAGINTLPYFLFRSVTEKDDGRKLCYHNFALYSSSPDTLNRDCKVFQMGTAVSKLLLAFLLPLVVIAGSYIQIALRLRNRSKRREQSTSRHTAALTSNKDEQALESTQTTPNTKIFLKPLVSSPSVAPKNTHLTPVTCNQIRQLSPNFTKMVTFVISAFVLCWVPYHGFCIIEVSAQYWTEQLKLVEEGLPIATTFAFFNPVLNPILYVFSCPNFVVKIRQSLCAVFDGLGEEQGGVLSPRRNPTTNIWRKCSPKTTAGSLGSPSGVVSAPFPRE